MANSYRNPYYAPSADDSVRAYVVPDGDCFGIVLFGITKYENSGRIVRQYIESLSCAFSTEDAAEAHAISYMEGK